MAAYILISFVSITYTEVVPLWAISSEKHDGLAMSQLRIGYLMSLTGAILVIYTFFLYPKIADCLGPVAGFKAGQWAAVLFAVLTPLLKFIPLTSPVAFPALVILFAAGKASTALCFSSIALILNKCVEKDKRASLNGLNMAVGSFSKSVGPSLGTWLFAWSINTDRHFPFDFHFIFIVISVAGVLSAAIPLSVEDNKAAPILASKRAGGQGVLSAAAIQLTGSANTIKYSRLGQDDEEPPLGEDYLWASEVSHHEDTDRR